MPGEQLKEILMNM